MSSSIRRSCSDGQSSPSLQGPRRKSWFTRSRPTRRAAVWLCALFGLALPVRAWAQPRAAAERDGKDKPVQLIAITSPQSGSQLDGASVRIDLAIATRASDRSLVVILNGERITDEFHPSGRCRDGICPQTAMVKRRVGLRKGLNRVVARIGGPSGQSDQARVSFSWEKDGDTEAPTEAPFQLAPAIGFTTLAPGGQAAGAPWIQMSSNGFRGGVVTYPKASDTTCTTTYQVLVIDRQTLAETSYACYDTDAELTAALGKLVPADPGVAMPDLVVVGTGLFKNAGSGLNTTAIGGTDYSQTSAANRPQGYLVIGVGGASSGASESFYLSSWLNDDPDSGSYLPQLNGVLATDANGNYVFHPTNNTIFSVVNSAATTQVTVNDTVASVTYAPPQGSTDGFWLLALKRTKLGNLFSCDTNAQPTPCGQFYNTGNTDTSIATQQANLLATALTGASSEQLLFLVSVGRAVSVAPPAVLSEAVETLGGAVQTLLTMSASSTTDAYNYTLISSNDPSLTKTFPGGNVVVSSNLATLQGQTGSVYGVLSRGLNSLYVPVSVNQGNVLTDKGVGDESMYQIAWTQPGPWPAVDTDARRGAYRYLSYMVTQAVLDPAAATDDIRSLYTSSNNSEIVASGKPLDVPVPLGGSWTDVAPGSVDEGQVFTFTPADLTFVATQLAAEIRNLQTVGFYMNGSSTSTGLKPAIVSGDTSTVFAMIGAAAAVTTALGYDKTATSVTVNPAAMVNILRGTTAIVSLVVPEAAPVLTLAASTMWLATAASPLGTSTGIPSPFNDVSKTVTELASEQEVDMTDVSAGFDEVMDTIYSDWGKLNAVATNVLVVWEVKDQTYWDKVSQALTQSAGVHFYSELVASVYSMDVFVGQPASVTTPSGIGSIQMGKPPCHFQCAQTCVALYSSSRPANGWAIHGLGPSHDFLIVGGPISSNNTNAMHETFPTSDILNTLFGTDLAGGDLNLSNDLFFAGNGILQRRVGTAAPGFSGGTLCYNF
jgi:hypothetical protein